MAVQRFRQISQDLVDGEFSSILALPLIVCHHLITLSALASTFGGKVM